MSLPPPFGFKAWLDVAFTAILPSEQVTKIIESKSEWNYGVLMVYFMVFWPAVTNSDLAIQLKLILVSN